MPRHTRTVIVPRAVLELEPATIAEIMNDVQGARASEPLPVTVSTILTPAPPQSMHGFTIGEWVAVTSTSTIRCMLGKICAFSSALVGVDFSDSITGWDVLPGQYHFHKCEGDTGHPTLPSATGVWFTPSQLTKSKFKYNELVELRYENTSACGNIVACKSARDYVVTLPHARDRERVRYSFGYTDWEVGCTITSNHYITPSATCLTVLSNRIFPVPPDDGTMTVTVTPDGGIEFNHPRVRALFNEIKSGRILKGFVSRQYHTAIQKRSWESSRLYYVVENLVNAGVPLQELADSILAMLKANELVKSASATYASDDLVRMLEADSATIVIGAQAFKLSMIKGVDGRKYAVEYRKRLKDKVDQICKGVLQAAKDEAEMQRQQAARQLREAQERAEEMMSRLKAIPEWMVANEIPTKFVGGMMYVGFHILPYFLSIEATIRDKVYKWDCDITLPHVQCWLPVGVTGLYDQKQFRLDRTTEFVLPHISRDGSCHELDDMPAQITTKAEYDRARNGFARATAVVNLNSLLRTFVDWPTALKNYVTSIPELLGIAIGCRVGSLNYHGLDPTTASHVVTLAMDTREMVSVVEAGRVAAMPASEEPVPEEVDIEYTEAQEAADDEVMHSAARILAG